MGCTLAVSGGMCIHTIENARVSIAGIPGYMHAQLDLPARAHSHTHAPKFRTHARTQAHHYYFTVSSMHMSMRWRSGLTPFLFFSRISRTLLDFLCYTMHAAGRDSNGGVHRREGGGVPCRTVCRRYLRTTPSHRRWTRHGAALSSAPAFSLRVSPGFCSVPSAACVCVRAGVRAGT